MNGSTPRVWLVDDDASIRWILERALRNGGMAPRGFDAAGPVIEALAQESPDVLLTDIQMPGQCGLELLRKARETHPALPVIVMTGYSELGYAVSSYKYGAFEYIAKPFDLEEAVALVRRAANTRPHLDDRPVVPSFPKLLGPGPAMQHVFRTIGRLARSNVTVLITGEAGTGKKLVARAIHDHSPRAPKSFMAVNIATISPDRVESELFGHQGGPFTTAEAQQPGCFEQADGGTLFLDKVEELSAPLQIRLLRLLGEGEFCRIGAHTPTHVDVRIIAASQDNLEDRVTQGQFREDLYHRLNVIRIELPPLRARPEDIPVLLDHYLKVAAHELSVRSKILSQDAEARLTHYSWPGNVRELADLCRRLTLLAPGSEVQLQDLPLDSASRAAVSAEGDWKKALSIWAHRQATSGNQPLLDEALPEVERVLIDAALKRTLGHRAEAAKLLGWGRNTLTQKMKALGMDGG